MMSSSKDHFSAHAALNETNKRSNTNEQADKAQKETNESLHEGQANSSQTNFPPHKKVSRNRSKSF